MPGFVQMSALERALRIDRQKLRELNPALLRSVWDGQRHVPKAYHLRLPPLLDLAHRMGLAGLVSTPEEMVALLRTTVETPA